MTSPFTRRLIAATIALTASVAVGYPFASRADIPAPEVTVATGSVWKVEFANHIVETVVYRRDGSTYVVEPLRSSAGKPASHGTSTIIRFDDDRTERWTAVGNRYVVEHWFPSSQFQVAAPVVGIADRIE